MKKMIHIGQLSFKYKKDVIAHFKNILNSYKFKETLNTEDFVDVLNLLKIHPNAKEKIGAGIEKVIVKETRYKTKCFSVIRVDSSCEIFSYMKCINGSLSPLTKFSKTCRDVIADDLRLVKLSFFKGNSKKGKVKCQETGELSLWVELNVDHRQPNTFSVIVDRFIELHKIDLLSIEYIETMDNVYSFKNDSLSEKFRKYHKEKANLRIVRKDKNLGRSHLARNKRQKKDLTIQ
ncbi:MAG: DCL family protein [Desulfocapsa sp.]|nr:DCL family protein [Desulfocapsa sp.]